MVIALARLLIIISFFRWLFLTYTKGLKRILINGNVFASPVPMR